MSATAWRYPFHRLAFLLLCFLQKETLFCLFLTLRLICVFFFQCFYSKTGRAFSRYFDKIHGSNIGSNVGSNVGSKGKGGKFQKLPSLPSPHSDNGGHSVGNGHREPGPGPQGGASGPRGHVPEAKGRGTGRGGGAGWGGGGCRGPWPRGRVPEALRPHPEGPGPALRDHSLLSGPRCRSEGKEGRDSVVN